MLTFRFLVLLLAVACCPIASTGETGNHPERDHSIDLLSLLDASRDQLKGRIALNDDELTMKSRWFLSAIRIPYLPSGQYDLELEFNRLEGRDGIGIVLPLSRQRQVALVLGGYPGRGGLDGLNYVEDKNLTDNGTGKKSCLQNKKKIDLTIHVRDQEIRYRWVFREL